MRDLPAEIYTNIFLYLEREELQKCYFVCKRWHTMAIPLVWEAVALQSRDIYLVKSHLNDLDCNQYFKYSHLIKKLAFQESIDHRDTYKFNRLELLELLNQLPNLNEIDFSETNYLEEYLGYLLDTDMQHINKIDTGTNLYDIRSDLLFSVYYKFSNSITCICSLYNRNTIEVDSQQINIINSLTQFKKLTKLELYNKHDIDLTPFQVQDNCPNLEYLVFASNHPISESAMQRILDDDRRINLNFISSLTYLDLYLPSLPATYTRYLVDYFPNQLTDLTITSRQNIFNWIDIVGMELALRLKEKAGGIGKVNIRFLGCGEYQVQANDENNMTKYLRLLNSFRGTRQTHCTATFNDTAGEIKHLGDSFRYDSLGRLFVTYYIYESDLYGSDTDMMAVPDKTSSIIGPEIFHFLEFNLSDLRSDGDLYRVLKYSLSNCPRLQSLNVTFDLDEDLHYSLSLRHKNRPISFDQANRDMNFLQMEHIRLSENLVDLLATHLHNIEIVSLKAQNWSCEYNNPVIDLTGFKELKSFKYTGTDNCCINEDTFVLIKYTNGTERCIGEYNAKTKDRDNLGFTVLCDISVSLDFHEEE